MRRIQKMFLESFRLHEAEGDDIFRSRTRSDQESFESGLDGETSASKYDTEDLGFDPTESQEDRFAEAYGKVEGLNQTIEDLISPDSGSGSLLKLLAEIDKSDSIAKGAADKVRKDAKKASDALSSIINELKTIASMEPSLRRKLESLKST